MAAAVASPNEGLPITDRIYQEQSYQFQLSDATVLSTRREGTDKLILTLDKTILFPEGGGQPTDFGRILVGGAELKVEAVRMDKATNVIEHVVSAPAGTAEVAVGAKVAEEVDRDRRLDHMQQHTAQHLITALAVQHLGYATTSWNLLRDFCSIDLDTKEMSAEELQKLERIVNEEIRAAHPVVFHQYTKERLDEIPAAVRSRGVPTDFLDKIRLVEIQGIDMNTCCGTHVTNTSQLQLVKFLPSEKNCGKVRINFLAGERAMRALTLALDRERALTKLLSSGPENHAEVVTNLQAESREKTKEVKNLTGELAELLGESLSRVPGKVAHLHRGPVGKDFFQGVVRVARASRPDLLVFLTAEDGAGGALFHLAGPPEVVTAVAPRVAELLGGKGGGKNGSYQGKAPSVERRGEVVAMLEAHVAAA